MIYIYREERHFAFVVRMMSFEKFLSPEKEIFLLTLILLPSLDQHSNVHSVCSKFLVSIIRYSWDAIIV